MPNVAVQASDYVVDEYSPVDDAPLVWLSLTDF